jgi:protein SCO1/2
MWHLSSLAALLTSILIPVSHAYDPNDHPLLAEETPKQLQGLGIDEHLGKSIDLTNTFKDENGQTVALQKYFQAGQPVILTIVYYDCPGLCNFHLNGLTAALKKMSWTVGKEYQVVAVRSLTRRRTAEPVLSRAGIF